MATILNTSSQGEIVVISVEGLLTLGSGVRVADETLDAPVAFRHLVLDQLAKGVKKMVVDLLLCSGFDSSGIGALVISYTKTANEGGQIVLVLGPKTRAMDQLQVTRMITIFKVFDSVATAIQGLTASKTA